VHLPQITGKEISKMHFAVSEKKHIKDRGKFLE